MRQHKLTQLWFSGLLVVGMTACGFKHLKEVPVASDNPEPQTSVTLTLRPDHVYGFKTLQSSILKSRCSECHDNGVQKGGISFDNYAGATTPDVLEKIRNEVLVEKSMPPKKRPGMTDEEREIIGQWLDAGAPENDIDGVDASPSPLPSSSPSPSPSANPSPSPSLTPVVKVTYADVKDRIFTSRCLKCHDDNSADPKGGVTVNTFNDVTYSLDDIQSEVITKKKMPPKSEPAMPDADRALLKAWIDQGALE